MVQMSPINHIRAQNHFLRINRGEKRVGLATGSFHITCVSSRYREEYKSLLNLFQRFVYNAQNANRQMSEDSKHGFLSVLARNEIVLML